MAHIDKLQVINRDGAFEKVRFDRITKRLDSLAELDPPLDVDTGFISQKVISVLYPNMHTRDIDRASADICAQQASTYPDYGVLAVRILLSNIYKSTKSRFSEVIMELDAVKLINPDIVSIVRTHKVALNKMIVQSRDNLFDYFGIITLENMYLLVKNKVVVERPQYMWLRCAVEVHRDNLVEVKRLYDELSKHNYTHATPTLFNSCLNINQLSSCMLLRNREDSISGIFKSASDCANLGAKAAGLGISVDNIRANGSIIHSTQRPSKGVPSFLTVYDSVCRVVDQGGKRRMSLAVYISPWHADFLDILELKSVSNATQLHTPDLFYAVWMNKLLYKRASAGEKWSMFCPTDVPLLLSTYGDEFENAYIMYEEAGLARKQMPAQDIITQVARYMIETGGPYILNADSCNERCNLNNVSYISNSNLCAEILIPSGNIGAKNAQGEQDYEIGVCTLASLNLPNFVKRKAVFNIASSCYDQGEFDFNELHNTVEIAIIALNKIVDNQYYILDECKKSSLRHRPIGLGIQGLADVFMMMGLPYESKEARVLSRRISEEIYVKAINTSMDLVKTYGKYNSFAGSMASRGILQPQLWTHDKTINVDKSELIYDTNYNWDEIADTVKTHGLANSLLTAYMPTASTSQLMGNYQSFEPAITNIFNRHTLAGNFVVINKHLVADLIRLNLWNEQMKNKIIAHEGSCTNIAEIPPNMREVYKTAWEMNPRNIMMMAYERSPFICQTQSLNHYIKNPTISGVSSIINFGARLGLKTISYYTRSTAAREAIKFTIDPNIEKDAKKTSNTAAPSTTQSSAQRSKTCTDDVCTSCSS